MTMMKHVTIRTIQAADAAEAGRIWREGLQQTVDALAAQQPDQREVYQTWFDEYAANDCVEGGVTGVDGRGLLDFFANNEDRDRHMFVAVAHEQEQEDTMQSSASTVVGLVGIKRGMDPKKSPRESDPDYQWCSIWKMSVSAQARGKSVGSRLMQACEEWAKRRVVGVEAIRLYTGNPIAASFYMNKAGFLQIEKLERYGIYEKKL
jgi:GNAT superfamily N-acetyltransferase